jgi:hypothetical protein
MSHERQEQWSHRLDRLRGLQECFVAARRYDRAYKVHLAIQQVYDRWAGEVFRAHRAR